MLTTFGLTNVQNWLFRGTNPARPVTLDIALYTTLWGDPGISPELATGGTEVAVAGYSRITITLATIFNTVPATAAAIGGRIPTQVVSGVLIQTASAFAAPASVRSFAMFSGANPWVTANLNSIVNVPAGQRFQITAGNLIERSYGAL